VWRHILTPKRQVTYLGITLQVSGTIFSVHIKERLAAAIRSINDIRLIHRTSLETAMKLFRTKVLPTLTYGLEETWEYLSCKQLQELERLKTRCLRRGLGVSNFALSRCLSQGNLPNRRPEKVNASTAHTGV
jgi:hypothetical protein